MSGNTIPPKPSLHGQSAVFAAKARELNAASKPEGSNPGNALADKRCAVGSGSSREKAQSAGAATRSLFASLSNGFMGILHGAKSLAKSLTSYAFGPSTPQAALQPKKAMAAASNAVAQGAGAVSDFLNSTRATRDAYRGARDAVSPPQSTIDSLGRQASDALTDAKQAGKGLLNEAEQFFKKLF